MNVDRRTGEAIFRIGIDDRLDAGVFVFFDDAGNELHRGDESDLADIPSEATVVVMSQDDHDALFEAADAAGVMVPREHAVTRQ